jgi:hypothetical protein
MAGLFYAGSIIGIAIRDVIVAGGDGPLASW